MSTELKPCPFCGGKPRIDTEYDMDGFGNFHKVKCSNCFASSKAHFASSGNECPKYYQEVREEWQKRTESTELEKLRKELEKSRELLKCCQEYVEDAPVLRVGVALEVAKLNQD